MNEKVMEYKTMTNDNTKKTETKTNISEKKGDVMIPFGHAGAKVTREQMNLKIQLECRQAVTNRRGSRRYGF